MTDDLNDLQSRIQQAKIAADPDKSTKNPDDATATQTGIRAVTDVIATPIVCGAAGIGIDQWLDTSPIFFILLALLGLCAGFWNLSRMMNGNDSSVGFKRLQNKEKEANKTQLSEKEIDT